MAEIDITLIVANALSVSLPLFFIYYLIHRKLERILTRLDVIQGLAQGAFLHSSNIDREIYWLRRKICLEHYYPPDRIKLEEEESKSK